jgi:hypothetical protein
MNENLTNNNRDEDLAQKLSEVAEQTKANS